MSKQADLTGYCGLYCTDCIRYQSKSSELARKLLVELKKAEFADYAAIKGSPAKQLNAMKQFQQYSECVDVLEAIAAIQCNTPCRVGGGCPTFSCGILKCCQGKGLEGCWQCNIFETCDKFESLKSIHGDCPQQNLKAIKKFGIEKWASHRSKPYVWQ
jgi:hypothetical protein